MAYEGFQVGQSRAEKSQAILREVAEKYGRTVKDLLSSEKGKMYSIPRQEVMFRLYTECKHLSWPAIGRVINRDHSTCMHGVHEHCKRNGINQKMHYRPRVKLNNGPRKRFECPRTAQEYREVSYL